MGEAARGRKQISKVEPQVLAKMEIGKEDLISIVIAKHEESLEIERRNLDAQIKKLSKEKSEVSQKFTKLVDAHAQESLKEKIELVTIALQDLGFEKLKFSISSKYLEIDGFGEEDEDEDGIETEEVIKKTIKSDSATYHISITPDNKKGTYGSLQGEGQLELAMEEKVLLARIREIDSELQAKQDRAIEVRGDLANLGRKERQARARLATKVLEQTEEGRALLDSIQDVKALPLDS